MESGSVLVRRTLCNVLTDSQAHRSPFAVVDDQLYVKHADFNQADMVERQKFKGDERLYKHVLQKNSDALYFSSCKDPNKTWLPLLEKAYAKVHGDYESISGGITGYV